MILAALMLALQPAPGAEAPAATAPTIARPQWLRRPDGANLAEVYPMAARKARADGMALVTCKVTADGAMDACRVVSETPAGMGFGEAALKLMPYFRMRPTTEEGLAVTGGVVRIPIRFRLPPPNPS